MYASSNLPVVSFTLVGIAGLFSAYTCHKSARPDAQDFLGLLAFIFEIRIWNAEYIFGSPARRIIDPARSNADVFLNTRPPPNRSVYALVFGIADAQDFLGLLAFIFEIRIWNAEYIFGSPARRIIDPARSNADVFLNTRPPPNRSVYALGSKLRIFEFSQSPRKSQAQHEHPHWKISIKAALLRPQHPQQHPRCNQTISLRQNECLVKLQSFKPPRFCSIYSALPIAIGTLDPSHKADCANTPPPIGSPFSDTQPALMMIASLSLWDIPSLMSSPRDGRGTVTKVHLGMSELHEAAQRRLGDGGEDNAVEMGRDGVKQGGVGCSWCGWCCRAVLGLRGIVCIVRCLTIQKARPQSYLHVLISRSFGTDGVSAPAFMRDAGYGTPSISTHEAFWMPPVLLPHPPAFILLYPLITKLLCRMSGGRGVPERPVEQYQGRRSRRQGGDQTKGAAKLFKTVGRTSKNVTCESPYRALTTRAARAIAAPQYSHSVHENRELQVTHECGPLYADCERQSVRTARAEYA
ncbi:hypothetical protein BJ912DRAFT_932374 [Pholiota molesta]|nr:hypothetical protein BJ912DRAFT_932374 [Pholiota molesta]